MSKNLRICNTRRFASGNVCGSLKLVLSLCNIVPCQTWQNTQQEMFANFLDSWNSQIFLHRELFHLYIIKEDQYICKLKGICICTSYIFYFQKDTGMIVIYFTNHCLFINGKWKYIFTEVYKNAYIALFIQNYFLYQCSAINDFVYIFLSIYKKSTWICML